MAVIGTLHKSVPQAAALDKISVVTPVFNEQENIAPLIRRVVEVMEGLGRDYEVVAVDDGSSDRSLEVLEGLAKENTRVKVISFRRNFGQTAAIMAGIDYAGGDIIVLMDADLQNDPGDIPLLLAKLDEGYDVVSGWRRDRKDAAVRRNFLSRVANRVISLLSGVHLHDYGCTLKAYRATCSRACGSTARCTASFRSMPPGWGPASPRSRCVTTRAYPGTPNMAWSALRKSSST